MRNDKLDNLKAMLIYLVVFGHLLELIFKGNNIARGIYIIIYAFHIPMFVFTTGYFAGSNIKKILSHIAYPYILFSVLYQICSIYWWKDMKHLDWSRPYWLLWYLFATLVWSCSLPLWEKIKGKCKNVFLIFTLVTALLAGSCAWIGRNYALSRVIVFFPFFVLGKYWHQYDKSRKNEQSGTGYKSIILLFISIIMVFCFQDKIRYTWLYEATPYTVSKYHAGIRFLHLALGGLAVYVAMHFIPDREIKCISETGKHTMPIYLLHGFFVKTLQHYDVVNRLGIADKKTAAVMLCALTAAFLVKVLSLPVVVNLFSVVVSPWNILKKTRSKK